MDSILTSRFELLEWSNLFIPFQELIVAERKGIMASWIAVARFNSSCIEWKEWRS